ncbi:nitrilase [Bathymodiolus platifrons methanotrophic gill symbiont]|uniref:carbon-nitrogen hydrolase family protein n=1 Tax=Bathymodiolus platifrons methanotrophic gill symbiont TaxID=113268 RepID=UPI000B416897|nr:carbon-nitrogen hydrolase family protein [Bathymodiolus platifrons methanotrophic gill symbiont]TXK96860.1 acyltransferase [Methylococcaceae bacterium CS4]TXK98711.1 acyltransferase [Methylococcaceae bacterium CS5]TXL05140.1 acyltransferase [Methylococcaceae bacterium CS1]TXL07354.1 acyltransferase [Methylococcaceae bacterium CS3]TXL09909.1 acyltransferase [Methylococcaceae bacterium CS2]TXL13803.1 acyltransferase [Methylococcaceae bacterium HT4]TXL19321.1 acyltransferase [Methylococcacea
MSKCAAIQMASSPNISSNLIEAERLIADASNAGAKLVALPENFALMGQHEHDKIEQKEQDGSGPIQDFLANTAKKYAVWIVAGTLPLADPNNANKVMAACLIYNELGERVTRYDKIHLFDVHVPGSDEVYRESDSISKGNVPLVIDSPFGKLGIAVCYDLRFPELFRTLQEQGMEVLIIPSAFTQKTGAAHWELLLRARAVENLCYVIAPNQGGFHVNGRQTYGHSMIIDPWGTVLNSQKTNAGFVEADIDLARLHKTRTSFPVLQHRQIVCG